LIPTSGIAGADEQERRATSALLSVMEAVKDFGKSVVKPCGAIVGNFETYIEVPFQLGDQRLYPDGLIRVTRGSKKWVALVEVKTGTNKLEKQQLENYLDIARDEGFDAVITISNEMSAIPDTHPTDVDKRKTKKVALHHIAWTQILSEAVMHKEHRGISDPEQAWILSELIRYLEHPRSGALEFEDMGSSWTTIRDAVQAGTFRTTDKTAPELVGKWDQLIRYVSLRLGRQLGVEVQPVISKNELSNPTLRVQNMIANLAKRSTLEGTVKVSDAVAPFSISADLRAGQITVYVDVEAPKDGRPQTRVNWLVRQLQDAPDGVRIDCFAMHSRGASTSELLKTVRDDPKSLIDDDKRDLRSFRIALSAPMGAKRGMGRGGFVQSVLDLVDEFYGSVLRNIKPWAVKSPTLREEAKPIEPVQPSLRSTSISSQDGPGLNGGAQGGPSDEQSSAPHSSENPVTTSDY
jgi:hypothetical protein